MMVDKRVRMIADKGLLTTSNHQPDKRMYQKCNDGQKMNVSKMGVMKMDVPKCNLKYHCQAEDFPSYSIPIS